MALSTYQTFLMKGTGSGDNITYSKLVDITSSADWGQAPDMKDATTLSDKTERKVMGITKLGDGLTYKAFYDAATYTTLKAIEDNAVHDFAEYLGGTENSDGTITPTGVNGILKFSGYFHCHKTGAEVDGIHEIEISIAPTSALVFSVPSGG